MADVGIRTPVPLRARLAVGAACAALAQAVQVPFFLDGRNELTAGLFVAHGLVVAVAQLGFALLLGRRERAWTAAVLLAPLATVLWPLVHARAGAAGLVVLLLVAVAAVAGLARTLREGAPCVAVGGEVAVRLLETGASSLPSALAATLPAACLVAILASRLPRPFAMPAPRPALALAGFAAAGAWLLGPARNAPLPVLPPVAADAGRPPIVLIVLDTLRADHLAAYGYARLTMPALERFARERGVLVERALANSSTSLPSHASLFTGLVPPRHGARYPSAADPHPPRYAHPLRPGIPTLAELLAAEGYATIAVSANAGALSPSFGVARGFHVYRAVLDPAHALKPRSPWALASRQAEPFASLAAVPPFRGAELVRWGVPYRRARSITDEAIAWLDAAGPRPFFLFVNYFDAHLPYDPLPACRDGFPGRSDALPPRGISERSTRQVMRGERALRTDEREHLVALYDAELLCLDAQLARLLERLERDSRWDEMLVIVTSDHGEAFGEHGLLEHGTSLYDELVRVPLVVKPGRGAAAPAPGTRISGPVQSVDVFATALEHVGLRPPDDGDGRAWGRGRTRSQAWIGTKMRFVDWQPDRLRRDLHAIEENGWKLIVSSRGERELYDLARDPGERVDLSGAAAGPGARLEPGDAAPVEDPEPGDPADPETVERLRALGYLR